MRQILAKIQQSYTLCLNAKRNERIMKQKFQGSSGAFWKKKNNFDCNSVRLLIAMAEKCLYYMLLQHGPTKYTFYVMWWRHNTKCEWAGQWGQSRGGLLDQWKHVGFQKIHNQGLLQIFLTVSCGTLCLDWHTWQCSCIPVVPKQRTSWGWECCFSFKCLGPRLRSCWEDVRRKEFPW